MPAAFRRLSGTITIPIGASTGTASVGTDYNAAPVSAVVSQAAADGTLLYIARALIASGVLTVYGNANATAAVTVRWFIPSVDE